MQRFEHTGACGRGPSRMGEFFRKGQRGWSEGSPGQGQGGCSDLIVLLSAQTKGQLELDVVLRAAGRGLGEREREGPGGARATERQAERGGRAEESQG